MCSSTDAPSGAGISSMRAATFPGESVGSTWIGDVSTASATYSSEAESASEVSRFSVIGLCVEAFCAIGRGMIRADGSHRQRNWTSGYEKEDWPQRHGGQTLGRNSQSNAAYQ